MKIIVLDDDPTGSQTVYGCPLLLRWDQKSLIKGLRHHSSLLFLLTNTRAMSSSVAAQTIREICFELLKALQTEGILLKDVFVVSRGDSTLRGHGVLEPEVLANELGPFDATFHVPAFLECGRTTVHGVHLLNGQPVHKTPFANDQFFGYSHSDLADWLAEKSGGLIQVNSVFRLDIAMLDNAVKSQLGVERMMSWLAELSGNRLVIVDAILPAHLSVFGDAVRALQGRKRFLFRSAASLINALSDLQEQTFSASDFVSLKCKNLYGKAKPGLVMVGSHVPLADRQLQRLLNDPKCVGLELAVDKLASSFEGANLDEYDYTSDLECQLLDRLEKILISGKTPVLYTSRGEFLLSSLPLRRSFGIAIAELMSRLALKLIPDLGYIISKGGITTQTLLSHGLNLDLVQLQGQLMPGLSIVLAKINQLGLDFPIVTFPGNLGEDNTLLSAWRLMENE